MESVKGTIYLLHFSEPFKHAKHYLGWAIAGGLDSRLKRHQQGNGARLLRVVKQAGITWVLARTWQDEDRHKERSLKKSGKARFCPVCKGKSPEEDITAHGPSD